MEGIDPTIGRVLTSLAAADPEAARDAEAALGWLTAGEDIGQLTQEGLQVFLWYQLPMKWLTDRDHHRRVAAALARALDLLGLARYAAICRSPTTTQVLEAYESSPARGKAAFRRAHLASGIVPPDLPEFAWGPVMGLEEARALSSTAGILELAVAAGDLVPGRSRWKARQREIAGVHLADRRRELGGRSYLEVIRAERLAWWRQGRFGSRARQRLLAPIAERLGDPVPLPPGAGSPLPPLAWLLERLAPGLALTQTGNLNRAFVQEAATRFGWWPTDFPSLPRHEGDLYDLHQVRWLAERLGALRRTKRTLTLSAGGRALLRDPEAQWRAAAGAILPNEPFFRAVGEMTLAVLAVEPRVYENGLDATVAEVIAEEDWRDRRTGEPADDRAVSSARHQTTNLLRALNLSASSGRWPDHLLSLTEVGKATAWEALRQLATGPRYYPLE